MRRAILIGLGLALLSCAPQALEGSLAELMPLEYDRAMLRVDDEAVVVAFLREGDERGTVLKLTIALDGLDASQPLTVDLASRLDDGRPRASVSRAMGSEVATLFPEIASGELQLTGPPEPGRRVSGSFHLVLSSASRLETAGRTARGTLEEVPIESP